MSAPKHAPGPWKPGIVSPAVRADGSHLVSAAGRIVATVWRGESAPWDALLIAAAPEMAEALGVLNLPGVVAYIPIVWNGREQVAGNTIPAEIVRAALRKAGILEGE